MGFSKSFCILDVGKFAFMKNLYVFCDSIISDGTPIATIYCELIVFQVNVILSCDDF